MNKDYGEILLESMSTLLEAYNRALAEPVEEAKSEKKAHEEAMLSTADPFLNFLPTATKTIEFNKTLTFTKPTPPAETETTPPAETETTPPAETETTPPAETETTPPADDKKPSLPNLIPEGSKISSSWSYFANDKNSNILVIEALVSTARPNTELPADGDFGIMVGVQVDDKVKAAYLNRNQMFGNVYKFQRMPHKMLVSLPENANISNIAVTCYNAAENLNFTVHSVTLSLGQDLQVTGASMEPFQIICAESTPRFTVTDRGETVDNGAPNYVFEAQYVGKNADDRYFVVTSENQTYCPEDFRVRWYKYSPETVVSTDEFGGTGWVYLTDADGNGKDGWSYRCEEFDFNHEFEKFKAVLIGTNFETGEQVRLTSNEIAVEREVRPTDGFINKLNIELADGSNGVYPFYEMDGYARTGLLPLVAKEREAKYNFETVYLNDDKSLKDEFLSNLQSIEWIYEGESIRQIIPKDSDKRDLLDGYTVTNNDGTQVLYTINTFIDDAGYSHYQYTDFGALTADMLPGFNSFKYNLAKHIIDNDLADKISCKFTFKNGQAFEATRAITLNRIGMNGTGYTVVSRLFNALNNLVTAIPMGSSESTYYLDINVYDINGNLVQGESKILTPMIGDSWTPLTQSLGSHETSIYRFWLPAFDTQPQVYDFKFTFTSGDKPIHLNEKILIPVCASGYENKAYQGVTTVIYSSEGNKPSYNNSKFALLPEDKEALAWELKEYGKFNDKNELICVLDDTLFPKTDNDFFAPVGTWDKKMENDICFLEGSTTTNTIWVQPIIFLQNKHFSPIIDTWDGSFQINEEGNYILASAYVAGGKDEETNTFTGVVMGELGTIAPETNADGSVQMTGEGENQKPVYKTSKEKTPKPSETGIFGYRQGSQSFGFKTDGTAFLGEQGGGRINFDGNGGVIYSGNFDGFGLIETKDDKGNVIYEKVVNQGTQGTYLDLQEGLLLTSNGNFRGSLTVANGDLAGWSLDDTGIYRIRTYKYNDGVEKTFVAGINSEIFDIRLASEIGFNFTSLNDSPYYQKITGPSQNGNNIEKWEIPKLIDRKSIQKLETTFDSNRTNMNYWSGRWINSKLATVAFDPSIPHMEIDDYFFYYASNLKNVYIPSSVSRIGHYAFGQNNSNMNIYLESPPRDTWPSTWCGKAKVQIAPEQMKHIMDFKTTGDLDKSEMIRFYAGTENKAPTIEAWKEAIDKKKNVFLVTDTGEMKVTVAEIKTILGAPTFGTPTIGSVGNSNFRLGELGQINMVGFYNNVPTSSYLTEYQANGIVAKDNFVLSSEGQFELSGAKGPMVVNINGAGNSLDYAKVQINFKANGQETKSLDIGYYDAAPIQAALPNLTHINELADNYDSIMTLVDAELTDTQLATIKSLGDLDAVQVTRLGQLGNLTYGQAIRLSSLGNLSYDQNTRLSSLGNFTANQVTRLSSLGNFTANQVTRLSSLGGFSADQVTRLSSLGGFSADQVARLGQLGNLTEQQWNKLLNLLKD